MMDAQQEPQSNVDPHRVSSTFDELIAMADEQYGLYQKNLDNSTYHLAVRHYCAAFDLGPGADSKVDHVISFFRFYYTLLPRVHEQAVRSIADKYLDKALEFTPPTHNLRPVLLGIQASTYSVRYHQTQDPVDLHSAVEIFQAAVATISVVHPQIITPTLADAVWFSPAEQQFRTVLVGCPEPLLIPTRRSLAWTLDIRYRLRYDINDIELAIEAYAAVVDSLQERREYLLACMGYATVLRARFHRKGNIDDIHVAIKYSEVVVRGCPLGHQHYVSVLFFHASLLINRSEYRQSVEDIDRAIEYISNAMIASRADDTIHPQLVSNLGYYQVSRFIHSGSVRDLEDAVENCYAAISMDSSLDAAIRASHLNGLAFVLFARYQLQGDKMDSIRAKAYFHQALEQCPSGDPVRLSILNNYARTLGTMAKKNSDLADLELSVRYFYEALNMCYASTRSIVLANLSMNLLHRYSLLRDPSDAEVAFCLSKTALESQPEDHWSRARTYLIQAKAVIAMFPKNHTLVDVEIALDILYAARETFNSDNPLLIETHRELSRVHFLRHSITNNSTHLEQAFKHRKAAAQYSNGGSEVQFEAAMQWIEAAQRFGHPSLLDAYKCAIRILDLHLVLKPSVDLRHEIIKAMALSICVDATSCALRSKDIVGAVEMFEQSRGWFWNFMARLRTPLDELRASGPSGRDLADKFELLGRQLENPVVSGDDGEYGQSFRRIQRDWNAVVDKIRSVDGFGKFLLPPSYADLRVAAIEGPVIILNASRHACDAIIVLANADPIHIAFPEGTFATIVNMSSELNSLRRTLRQFPNDSKDPQKGRYERRLAGLLRSLWDAVVCEVVDSLEPHVPKNSRIWWCPTGVFTSLPIHAANPYRKGESGLSDIYVSSYTPTLSALIRSRNKRSSEEGIPNFVAIGQPNAVGHNPLATVHEELDMVRQLLPKSLPFTELLDEVATREAALMALRTHTFAHLACHGEQVPDRPHDSYFAMRDGPLKLLDIVDGQHDTEFAFLSACKTAMGDVHAPDEMIHLAAGLQFAGVRSVVGTMWAVDDEVVVHTVEGFYRAMVREDGVFDPCRAARGLRAATRATVGQVPLEQRIVFIHIGV